MKISLGIKPYGKEHTHLGVNLNSLRDDIENASCDEIVCVNLFYIVPNNLFNEVVKLIASKLRKGGKLTVIDRDCMEVAKKYVRGDLNSVEFSNIMYNLGNNSAYNMKDVNLAFASTGLKVIKKKPLDIEYVLEYQRC
jgi:hypothetical protein